GNVYVAAAKRRVFGLVNIDMIAGPSEILIISDKTGNPVHIAADMLSQAEHDPMASAVLVTDSEELASKVSEQIEIQLNVLPRKEICRTSIDGESKIIIAKNLDEAIDISNALAPEHLEIVLDNPFDILPKIKNAGSIFLGKNCPEALGDYFAGPNHTLPTSGTARFSSPLSVDDFIKKSSYIYYTEEAIKDVAEDIAYFAESEGLSAHAQSALSRLGREKYE
ncbi:MAG: histidinol dehydrogenase, partial [Clostridia bacterium]|nr:histidinol dehydrogenase [Clostridia bacterium]